MTVDIQEAAGKLCAACLVAALIEAGVFPDCEPACNIDQVGVRAG